jgi:hypothetical protein
MNLADLKDIAICMIVWNTEKEDDVHVYLGKLQLQKGEHYFINEEKGWKVSLQEEQLSRLKPVPGELKVLLLNADYALSMNMCELPQFNSGEYQKTGMKWNNRHKSDS